MTTQESTGARSFATTAIIFGLGLVFVGALLATVAFVIGDELGLIVITAPFLIGAPLIAWLVLSFGTWARVVSAIGSLAALFFTAPAVPFGIEHIDSFFDFAPFLIAAVGGLIGLIASIWWLIKERGQAVSRPAEGPQLAMFGGVAAVLALVAVVSAVLTISGRDSVSASEREGATLVEMKGVEFEQESLEAAAGEEIKLVVENNSPIFHTFTIDELDVDVDFGPGDEKIIEFTVAEGGTYRFFCDVDGHEDMEGDLQVSN